jgi:hypothetical protein
VAPDICGHRAIVCVPLVELKSAGMMGPAIDVRFFARASWFVVLCAFLWLLAFAHSGQRWVFPVAFVGLCVYAVCQVREKPTPTDRSVPNL